MSEAHIDPFQSFRLMEERLRRSCDREADRMALIDALRELWAQGKASGAAIENNFDADEIARRGERWPTNVERND